MARRKRPSVRPGGLTSDPVDSGAAPVVQAQGVDVFTPPGAAGMPQAPTAAPLPVELSQQDARDWDAMGKALGGLSQTLGQLAKAEALGSLKMAQYGAEELKVLKAEMDKTGKTFADMHDADAIPFFQHPAAIKAFSAAMSRITAEEHDSDWEIDTPRRQASNPNILDHAKMMQEYDDGLKAKAREISSRIARPDVFERELLLASSPLRARTKKKHEKYISEKYFEQTTNAFKIDVQNAVLSAAEMEPEVTMNMTEGPPPLLARIEGWTKESPEDLRERKLEFLKENLTNLLDSQYGGPLTNVAGELLGEKLIHGALNALELEHSELFSSVIDSLKTGPKDDRKNLVGKKGKLFDLYSDKKDDIERYQNTLRQRKADAIFNARVGGMEEMFTDLAVGVLEGAGEWPGIPFEIERQKRNRFTDAELTTMILEMHGGFTEGSVEEFGDGGTATLSGNTITYSNGNTTKPINLTTSIKNARGVVFRRAVEASEVTYGRGNILAHVGASAELGVAAPRVQQVLSATFNMAELADVDHIFTDKDVHTAKEAFAAYSAGRGIGGFNWINNHVSGDMKPFYELAYVLQNDETLQEVLGTTDTGSLLNVLGGTAGKAHPPLLGFEETFQTSWASYFPDESVHRLNTTAVEEVRMVAKGLMWLTDLDMEQSIGKALEAREERMFTLHNGIKVDRQDMTEETMTGYLKLDKDHHLSNEIPQVLDYPIGSRLLEPGLNLLGLGGPVLAGRAAVAVASEVPKLFVDIAHTVDYLTGGDVNEWTFEATALSFYQRVRSNWFSMNKTSERDITVPEALEAAEDVLRTAAPKWFSGTEDVDIEIIGFFPYEDGTNGGSLYQLKMQDRDGTTPMNRNNPKTNNPWTMAEIVDLVKWKDKPRTRKTVAESVGTYITDKGKDLGIWAGMKHLDYMERRSRTAERWLERMSPEELERLKEKYVYPHTREEEED